MLSMTLNSIYKLSFLYGMSKEGTKHQSNSAFKLVTELGQRTMSEECPQTWIKLLFKSQVNTSGYRQIMPSYRR